MEHGPACGADAANVGAHVHVDESIVARSLEANDQSGWSEWGVQNGIVLATADGAEPICKAMAIAEMERLFSGNWRVECM